MGLGSLYPQFFIRYLNSSCTCKDMVNGTVADMQKLGIRESFKSKLQVLVSAAEAAEMILRVDDIIKCAPRAREQ